MLMSAIGIVFKTLYHWKYSSNQNEASFNGNKQFPTKFDNYLVTYVQLQSYH